MTGKWAGRAVVSSLSSRVMGACLLVAGLGLSGCSDVDTMLFGDSASSPDAGPAATQPAPEAMSPAPAPHMAASGEASAPYAPQAAPSGVGPIATITPVTISPGTDTGTAVSKTVASLRAQVSTLQGSLLTSSQRYNELRASGASAAARYYESRARITARLQTGTTRGNPELVAEWNRAQSALDQLAGNINSLNSLGTSVANDASTAHYALNQIAATFNVSGAVDEDHRQLSVLQDETNQTIVLVDRLLSEVGADVQRQTAYVANERANLTALATAIKNGELFGANAAPMGFGAAQLASTAAVSQSQTPIAVVRQQSSRPYADDLYSAVRKTLAARPSASFTIVGKSSSSGTPSAVALARTSAQRFAEDISRSMTEMGLPANRVTVYTQPAPNVSGTEAWVYTR